MEQDSKWRSPRLSRCSRYRRKSTGIEGYAEDWFLKLHIKKSSVPGVRDPISITLIVNRARVVAVDDNGHGAITGPDRDTT